MVLVEITNVWQHWKEGFFSLFAGEWQAWAWRSTSVSVGTLSSKLCLQLTSSQPSSTDPAPWRTVFTPPLKTSPSWWAGPTAMGPSAASSPTSSTCYLRGPTAIWLPCGAAVLAMPTTGPWPPLAGLAPRNVSASRTAAASTQTAPACWGCPLRHRPAHLSVTPAGQGRPSWIAPAPVTPVTSPTAVSPQSWASRWRSMKMRPLSSTWSASPPSQMRTVTLSHTSTACQVALGSGHPLGSLLLPRPSQLTRAVARFSSRRSSRSCPRTTTSWPMLSWRLVPTGRPWPSPRCPSPKHQCRLGPLAWAPPGPYRCLLLAPILTRSTSVPPRLARPGSLHRDLPEVPWLLQPVGQAVAPHLPYRHQPQAPMPLPWGRPSVSHCQPCSCLGRRRPQPQKRLCCLPHRQPQGEVRQLCHPRWVQSLRSAPASSSPLLPLLPPLKLQSHRCQVGAWVEVVFWGPPARCEGETGDKAQCFSLLVEVLKYLPSPSLFSISCCCQSSENWPKWQYSCWMIVLCQSAGQLSVGHRWFWGRGGLDLNAGGAGFAFPGTACCWEQAKAGGRSCCAPLLVEPRGICSDRAELIIQS